MTQEYKDKCRHCVWNMKLVDYLGHSWGRFCYQAVDGLLDGCDLSPRGNCFEPRIPRKEIEFQKAINRIMKLNEKTNDE